MKSEESVLPISNQDNNGNSIIGYMEQAQKIVTDPSEFVKFIKSISEDIVESKRTAEDIKNQGIFKRTFSSSSRQLACVMLSQYSVMDKFYVMLQAIAIQCGRNSVAMKNILEGMMNGLDMNDAEQKNIYDFAKSYLTSAIQTSSNEQLREDALKKVIVFAKETNDNLNCLRIEFSEIKERINNELNAVEHESKNYTDEQIREIQKQVKVYYELLEKENFYLHQTIKRIKVIGCIIVTIIMVISIILLLL